MSTKSGFRNQRREASLARKVATYRFKAVGTCAVSLWDPTLDRSCCHNSSTGQVRSNSPQDIRLLQARGHWTYIREFRCAVWFSQFDFELLNINSACWGCQNSRFGQWEYISIRREDLFVRQTEDASSNAGSVFGMSGSKGLVAWSLYKIVGMPPQNLLVCHHKICWYATTKFVGMPPQKLLVCHHKMCWYATTKFVGMPPQNVLTCHHKMCWYATTKFVTSKWYFIVSPCILIHWMLHTN